MKRGLDDGLVEVGIRAEDLPDEPDIVREDRVLKLAERGGGLAVGERRSW